MIPVDAYPVTHPYSRVCTELACEFFAEGVPVPQGSHVAVGKKVLEDRKRRGRLKAWRAVIANRAALAVRFVRPVLTGPCVLVCEFWVPRPPTHLKANGELRKRAPQFPIFKPDLLKLIRPVEDSLTDARIWIDDSREIGVVGWAQFCKADETPGVRVEVWTTPREGA
jgi:Holliday junction resolvase RusA-like endonuclease